MCNKRAKSKRSNTCTILIRKNATVHEPKSPEEGNTMFNYLTKEKRYGLKVSHWINYRDIQDQVSFVGVNDSVLLTSSYMGSLSTFNPLPIEWWNNNDISNKGGKRREGYHCAYWRSDGVADSPCTDLNPLVCEKDASERNLKEYIKSLDKGIVA